MNHDLTPQLVRPSRTFPRELATLRAFLTVLVAGCDLVADAIGFVMGTARTPHYNNWPLLTSCAGLYQDHLPGSPPYARTVAAFGNDSARVS